MSKHVAVLVRTRARSRAIARFDPVAIDSCIADVIVTPPRASASRMCTRIPQSVHGNRTPGGRGLRYGPRLATMPDSRPMMLTPIKRVFARRVILYRERTVRAHVD